VHVDLLPSGSAVCAVKLLGSIQYGDSYTICSYILWIISTLRIVRVPVAIVETLNFRVRFKVMKRKNKMFYIGNSQSVQTFAERGVSRSQLGGSPTYVISVF
jgi:hypothetical protein